MRAVRRSVVVALLAASVLAACDEHTVAIRFDPDVGDRYRFRSEIDTEVERVLDGEPSVEDRRSLLDATEEVIAVDGSDVTVAVTLERDADAPRSYEVRFDRRDRLTAIDLVEGVPADALGLDLATDLPADVGSPPAGRLEPGQTWTIERRLEGDGTDPIVVTGTGVVDSLGVVEGNDVAVVVVELRVPIRSVIETADGIVQITGSQTTKARTTYDLADGVARSDRTVIDGDADVVIRPPEGVEAPPVLGAVRYDISIETTRVRDLG